MILLNRYLFRQFSRLVASVLLVLLLISIGGFLADLIAEISRGKAPAGLMLQLLALRMPRFLVFVMPLAFPQWETASFFSTTLLAEPEAFDLVSMYIPSNPFNSLANGIVLQAELDPDGPDRSAMAGQFAGLLLAAGSVPRTDAV